MSIDLVLVVKYIVALSEKTIFRILYLRIGYCSKTRVPCVVPHSWTMIILIGILPAQIHSSFLFQTWSKFRCVLISLTLTNQKYGS